MQEYMLGIRDNTLVKAIKLINKSKRYPTPRLIIILFYINDMKKLQKKLTCF